jgi:hypothetical protein
MKVSGSFKVKLQPLSHSVSTEPANALGRMSIDKSYEGELTASSKGEMLSAVTAVKGSAGYVAIEQVSGSLNGKKGGFVLQHFGIMHNGEQRLTLEVVPESGSGELAGLRGNMNIRMENGRHFYDFDYQLPA